MKYLLIDTNVYIQCCLLELEEGDDFNVLKKLHSLLENNQLILLLPEVIELEFNKILEEKTNKLVNKIGEYKKSINKDNDLDSGVIKDLLQKLKECVDERLKNKNNVKQEIKEIFSHKNTLRLPLNSDIITEAYKLFLSGNKPYNKDEFGEIQPDCLILETAKDYFLNFLTQNQYEFYFCSLNKGDFTDKSITDNDELIIAKAISVNFKHIMYYNNLLKLLNDNFNTKYSQKTIDKVSQNTYNLENQLYSTFSTTASQSLVASLPGTQPLTLDQINYAKGNLTAGAASPSVSVSNISDISGAIPLTMRTCSKCNKSYYLSNLLVDIGLCDECRTLPTI